MNQINSHPCPDCGAMEGAMHAPGCRVLMAAIQEQGERRSREMIRDMERALHNPFIGVDPADKPVPLEDQIKAAAPPGHEWIEDELKAAPAGGPYLTIQNPEPDISINFLDDGHTVGRFWFDPDERRFCFKGDVSDAAQMFVDEVLSRFGGAIRVMVNPELDEEADRQHRQRKRAEARAAIYGRDGA